MLTPTYKQNVYASYTERPVQLQETAIHVPEYLCTDNK